MKRRSLKPVSPSSSYVIYLPDDVKEEYDDSISSFWEPDGRAALQLSSFFRTQGEQTAAQERLKARLERDGLMEARPFEVPVAPHSCESAAATLVDEQGIQWIHIYMTWPDLTIYATVSGPPDELIDSKHWAFEALRSLKRMLQ